MGEDVLLEVLKQGLNEYGELKTVLPVTPLLVDILKAFLTFCDILARERSHHQTLYDDRFFWKINNFLH